MPAFGVRGIIHSNGIPDSFCTGYLSMKECCAAMHAQFNTTSTLCAYENTLPDPLFILGISVIVVIIAVAVALYYWSKK